MCELVEGYLDQGTVKGDWTGPAALRLARHAPASVAKLQVRNRAKIAFSTVGRLVVRGRPSRQGGGSRGATSANSAMVRSLA